MTMRPAPTDGNRFYCSLDCRGTRVYMGAWTWDGRHSVAFCPDCGRALGFDASENPVVGPSPAQFERAADELATALYQRMGALNELDGDDSPDGFVQQALAATEEAADAE